MKYWKIFAVGALSMFIVLVGGYNLFLGTSLFSGTEKSLTPSANEPAATATNIATDIAENPATNPATPSDAVTITPLPSLRIIRGTEVTFEGKKELRQAIAGRLAQNIIVVNFQATGEHAEKSVIKIVWDNGEVEKVYPGTKERRFLSDKRAAEISILGYSMHERQIFKDSSRKGTLTWEIRYEPVEY